MSRKPNANSVLKTLPESRQAEIADYAAEHSLAATVKWLRDDGLATNTSSLSDFLSWHALQQQFAQDASTTDSLLEQLRKDMPGLTEEQLDDLGQRTFSLLAIRRQDLAGFVSVRSARTNAQLEKAKLKLREQAENRMAAQAKLARDKFEFDAAQACLDKLPELQVIRKDTGISDSEKLRQIRLKLFGRVAGAETRPAIGGAKE